MTAKIYSDRTVAAEGKNENKEHENRKQVYLGKKKLEDVQEVDTMNVACFKKASIIFQ